MQATAPELAVISAGADNSNGHPAPETLARLEALGSQVHRTDEEGSVTIWVRGEKIGIS